MRKSFSSQQRFDCRGVVGVQLNRECRDEIVPILSALQHIYSQPKIRDAILDFIAEDVNQESRDDVGRDGMDYWQILVLAAVRLGCNLDYDKLQDLAEQHRNLRHIMGIGDWNDATNFGWRRIRDNVCLLKPATIEKISQWIVAEGHALAPEAAKKVRGDSFVAETNIHYPTESSLIWDGLRKIILLSTMVADDLGFSGWRQHAHLLRKIKNLHREISRTSAGKTQASKEKLKKPYAKLLRRAEKILERAEKLAQHATTTEMVSLGRIAEICTFIERTRQVANTAYRRVMLGEKVPNEEKLFSLFETHTQLYRRGKQAEPNQFGRLVMVYEDGAGFISHYFILPRDAQDSEVVVEQTRIVQDRHRGRIEDASFDRGFYSAENAEQLRQVIRHPCLPKKAPREFREQHKNASVRFRMARQWHPGVESAIGALQFGNGLERCRDRTEIGFERYVALGILGRNLHVLGKLLIQQQAPDSEAAESRRKSAA